MKKKRKSYHLVIHDLQGENDMVEFVIKGLSLKQCKDLEGWIYAAKTEIREAPPRKRKPKDHKDQLDLYTRKKVR